MAIASKPRSTPTAVSQGTQHQQSQKYRTGFTDFNSFNNAMQRFSRDLCQSTKQYTMRYFSLILFSLALSFASCKKTGSNAVIPNGTYSGTFQRLINGGGQISNVTITFSGNTWTGQSQSPRYPALCKGAYKEKSADSVSFENNCPWTAEFDWSLILNGDYKIVTSGENIEMSHNYSNGYLDVYKLKRQ